MKRDILAETWKALFQAEGLGEPDKRARRYRVRTTTAGKVRDVEIYPIWDTKSEVRAAKAHLSGEAQAAYNEKRARKKITRLLNANFGEGDLMLTLTYAGERVPELEEAQKDMRNFLRRVKRWREKRGLTPLKYLYVVEFQDGDGRKKRVHHHVVLNAMPRDEAEALWQKGRCNSMRLQPGESGLTGMAAYLSKGGRHGKRWAGSRNLRQPVSTYADHKLSAGKVYRMAEDFGAAGREILEKIMPEYALTEGEVRWSDWVSGCYISATLRRRE